MDKLLNKHGDNLDEKSLTICSGTDYINVNYQHIICPDAATAKVCITHHNNPCPTASTQFTHCSQLYWINKKQKPFDHL